MQHDKALESPDVTETLERDLNTAAETSNGLANRNKSIFSSRPGSVL